MYSFCSEFSTNYFSHVLIDEAAQCNEAESLIPISFVNLKCGQVIMAGDPLQLPPITLSPHAKHFDLVKSMLERYLEMYKELDGIIPVCVLLSKNHSLDTSNSIDFCNRQFCFYSDGRNWI